MKKLSIVGILSLLAFGCGDDDDRDTRPMLMDSGTIMLPDSGTTDPVDSGTTTSECRQPLPNLVEINMDPEVMGQLLPRCSSDTPTCISSCMNIECLQACLDADTTEAVDIGASFPLDCGACFNIQLNTCIDRNCPTQFGDFRCCAEANGCADFNNCPACATESAALDSCIGASVTLPGCQPYTGGCFP